jgi:hypothetical protein
VFASSNVPKRTGKLSADLFGIEQDELTIREIRDQFQNMAISIQCFGITDTTERISFGELGESINACWRKLGDGVGAVWHLQLDGHI